MLQEDAALKQEQNELEKTLEDILEIVHLYEVQGTNSSTLIDLIEINLEKLKERKDKLLKLLTPPEFIEGVSTEPRTIHVVAQGSEGPTEINLRLTAIKEFQSILDSTLNYVQDIKYSVQTQTSLADNISL